MANFDIARLYGGRDFIDFPAGEEAIRAWFHHAQPEEIAIALHCAGLVQKEDTIVAASSDSGFATAAALVQAAVELACLCLEDFENLDAWKVEGSFETGKHGLKQLNKTARSSIPRVVLRDIGERLFEKSNLTSEEKKPSDPLHSLDS